MKTLTLIFLFPIFFFSCNSKKGEPNQSKEIKNTVTADSITTDSNQIYDYSKTKLEANFCDSVDLHFSSNSSKDRFTFFVQAGKIKETKSILRIMDNKGIL